MTRTIVVVPLLALLAAACGDKQSTAPAAPGTPEPSAAPPAPADDSDSKLTARTRLDAAIAEAQEWEADAELAVVSTSLADGPRHDFWFYDFQSPAKGTCTRIRALANGDVANVGTGGECILAKPVATAFVDSTVAYDAAAAAGFQKGDSVQFDLSYRADQALPAPRECWVLWSDFDGDEEKGIIRGWCVDPATGEFVVRLSGYGRPVRRD